MPQSYHSMLFHVVFATKERTHFLPPSIQTRLHSYLATMIQERFGRPIRIGGTEDHVHILLDKNPSVSEPDMLRDIKAFSSGWIHKTFPELADFAWQAGYGIFSVSGTHREMVAEYIRRQADHHRKVSLSEELIRLLKRNGVEYDGK